VDQAFDADQLYTRAGVSPISLPALASVLGLDRARLVRNRGPMEPLLTGATAHHPSHAKGLSQRDLVVTRWRKSVSVFRRRFSDMARSRHYWRVNEYLLVTRFWFVFGRITHRDHNGVEPEAGFRRKLAFDPGNIEAVCDSR